jgi:sulfate permease, SulP family
MTLPLKVELAIPSSAWLSAAASGLVIGFTEVILAASLASLIFAGALENDLARGIAIMVITSAIHLLFSSLLPTSDRVLSSVQDNPAVLLALASSNLALTIQDPITLAATVIALITVTTLLVGGLMLLMGYLRLGGLIRYIPYPVIGGFIAGAGWLLVRGALEMMSNLSLDSTNLPLLLLPDQLLLWLPGFLFGLFLFIGVQRIRHPLTLPGLILGGILLFYLALLLSGISSAEAVARGWLIGDLGQVNGWQLPFSDVRQVDWVALFGQIDTLAAVPVLTVVTLLLNISGLELMLHRDLDFNRELRFAGFVNLLSGLAGGSVGHHEMSFNTLLHRMGVRGRLPGIVAGILCLIVPVAGLSLIAYVPKALLGGLLLFFGLEFLYEWVIRARRTLSRTDYLAVLLILLMIALAGFLIGVAVGLVLMVLLFIVNYSRLNIFHRIGSGADITSKARRNAYHERALDDLSRHTFVMELQGFIFFGTANSILERVRQRLKALSEKPLQFLVLDFRRVTGLDASAVFSLTKLKYLAEEQGFTLVLTRLSPTFAREIQQQGLLESGAVRVFSDLDQGLEWCENQLLERDQVTRLHLPTTLQLQLADQGFQPEDTQRLKAYLEQIRLSPGDILIKQGEEADSLYFVELGQISIYLELDGAQRLRLQTLGMGTIVGELGFFLGEQRTASVIADDYSLVYALHRERLAAMKQAEADLWQTFNEWMLRVVCERLAATNRELAALNA